MSATTRSDESSRAAVSRAPGWPGLLPDLRRLQVFEAVAAELSIARAAARLHVSPQAVSRTLSRLELEVGSRLLDRSTRGVRLTVAGRELLEDTRPLLEHAASVMAAARARNGSGLLGRLRLGVAHEVEIVSEVVLVEFSAAHPGAIVDIRHSQSDELFDAVRAGDLDLAVALLGPSPPAGLLVSELIHTPVLVAVDHRHPLAGREAVAVADLAGSRVAVAPEPAARSYNAAVRDLLAAEDLVLPPAHYPAPARISLAPDVVMLATRRWLDRFGHADLRVLGLVPGRDFTFAAVWRGGVEDRLRDRFVEALRDATAAERPG